MFEQVREVNFWDNQDIQYGFIREQYISRLKEYVDNRLIKVILGQRRTGKSFILRMLIHSLINEYKIPVDNILYLNKDLLQLKFISNSDILIEIIKEYRSKLKPKGKIYVFLDEVQEIENWELAVNSLSQDYTREYEVFLTGSNANLLASELSTFLSGRYLSMTVFPFSFGEYLDFFKLERNKQSYITYMRQGGFPESYNLPNEEIRRNYISNLKDSIVLRDIVQRHNVRDVNLLNKVIDFLIDSVGSLFSINKVVNHLVSTGTKTNVTTVSSYLDFLEEAYFIRKANRFDLKGKKLLSREQKYYLNDLSFKYYLTSSFDKGVGKFLENIIFLELLRKGYTVYTGNFNEREIDFVAEKNGQKEYIQVAYLLPDEKTIKREFGNLEKIKDNFPKTVISMDDISFGNRNGINHLQAWYF